MVHCCFYTGTTSVKVSRVLWTVAVMLQKLTVLWMFKTKINFVAKFPQSPRIPPHQHGLPPPPFPPSGKPMTSTLARFIIIHGSKLRLRNWPRRVSCSNIYFIASAMPYWMCTRTIYVFTAQFQSKELREPGWKSCEVIARCRKWGKTFNGTRGSTKTANYLGRFGAVRVHFLTAVQRKLETSRNVESMKIFSTYYQLYLVWFG